MKEELEKYVDTLMGMVEFLLDYIKTLRGYILTIEDRDIK